MAWTRDALSSALGERFPRMSNVDFEVTCDVTKRFRNVDVLEQLSSTSPPAATLVVSLVCQITGLLCMIALKLTGRESISCFPAGSSS